MSVEEPEIPYGGTTGERLKAFALNAETLDRLSALAVRYWELASYGVLLTVAIILRYWNLGARAMHHDESLHSYFSYGFTKGLEDFFTLGTANNDGYKHVPFMHGPFQFIGPGTVMWILGDGDYQARVLAASMGTGMVALPFLLRKQLGTFGALAASLFIATSPTLTYYSRFIREDIYTAFWVFGMVVFAWRYMSEQKNLYLYLLAGFTAGLFLTKETSYMTVGIFVFFFEFLFASYVAKKIRAKNPRMEEWQFVGLTLLLIPLAWIIAFGWIFFDDWRRKYDLDEMPAEATLLVVMGSLSLPMYAAILQIPLGMTWRNRAEEALDSHVAPAEFGFAVTTIFGLIGLSIALGTLWKPKVWAIAAAFFWVPVILLSTTFFSNTAPIQRFDGWFILGDLPLRPDGFFSVIWGSLDYWISQQDVRRGNQPDNYYFITIPVYEFLPLMITMAAGFYYFIHGQLRNVAIVGAMVAAIIVLLLLPRGFEVEKVSFVHVIAPFTLVIIAILSFRMDAFTRFLMFWLVVTSLALTIAGEKMPWLNVHIALPLAVVAGRFVGDIIGRSDLRDDLPRLERLTPYLYAGAASAFAIVIFTLTSLKSVASLGAWLLVIAAAVTVYWAYKGYSRRTAVQVALVGLVAAFSIFTLRATILSSWGHPNNPYKGDVAKRDYGEVPIELLVYTQTSGDIPVLVKEVERAARESGQGANIPIVVDSTDGFTWPWAWYLRDSRFKNVTYTTISAGYTPPPGAILFVAQSNAANVQLGDAYGPGIPYHHRRWFPEEYRGKEGKYSTQDFFSDLFTPKVVFNNWLNYWVRREPPADLGAVDAIAFFPKSFDVSPLPPAETVRTEGSQLVIGQSGTRPGQLSGPADVYIDKDGNLWVADTNNSRVSKYGPDGAFISSLGGFGSSTPLNQPWSVTVADDGTVFVADTWNHKIVKFDKDGNKVKEWGAGGQTDENGDGQLETDDPFKLFGPREITLSPEGNVLITDTGNSRVIEYTPDGEFVRQFGRKGSGGAPDELSEPVGIEVAANGDVYIGDFWNRRVVVLDKDLKLKTQIAVEEWGSQQVTDRAYMALLDDGRLLVTDPTNGRIITFGADGARRGVYDVPKNGANPVVRPIGIASDGTSVLVSDSAGNVVRKIPLTDVAK
jgi:predicted membrane-bound mannosyltransferase/DNA-binding beta-propeller fold protein YncE